MSSKSNTKTGKKRTKSEYGKLSMEARVRLFVEAYMSNNGSLRESALAAGYSPGGADKAGYRMSKNVLFLSMLKQRQAETFDNLKITTERILLERARLAFFDPRKLLDKDGKPIPIHLLDDDTAAVIAGMDVVQLGGENSGDVCVVKKYRLADKNASLTSLERQKGMYREDNEQSKPVTKVVLVPAKKKPDV